MADLALLFFRSCFWDFLLHYTCRAARKKAALLIFPFSIFFPFWYFSLGNLGIGHGI